MPSSLTWLVSPTLWWLRMPSLPLDPIHPIAL
jgi:hypothetical protein